MFTTANFPVHLSTDYYGANCGSALHTKKASLSSSLGLTHRMLRSSRLSGESIPPTCCLEMVFIDRKTSHSKWFPSAQFTMEVYWKKLNMIPFLCQILVLQDTGSARYWFSQVILVSSFSRTTLRINLKCLKICSIFLNGKIFHFNKCKIWHLTVNQSLPELCEH